MGYSRLFQEELNFELESELFTGDTYGKPFNYLLCKIDFLYVIYQIAYIGFKISNIVYQISNIVYDFLYPT